MAYRVAILAGGTNMTQVPSCLAFQNLESGMAA
jgi:hypothetical protein